MQRELEGIGCSQDFFSSRREMLGAYPGAVEGMMLKK